MIRQTASQTPTTVEKKKEKEQQKKKVLLQIITVSIAPYKMHFDEILKDYLLQCKSCKLKIIAQGETVEELDR